MGPDELNEMVRSARQSEGASMTPQDMVKTLQIAGWTQGALARYTGTTVATINRISKGHITRPRGHLIDRLRRLIDAPTPANRLPEQLQQITMSVNLRDYFAANAMQGLFAAGGGKVMTADAWAAQAYMLADAMLKARGEA